MAKKPDDGVKSVRSTISIPAEKHETLQRIADKKRVSFAWVVRDAIEKYLEAEAPLFRQGR